MSRTPKVLFPTRRGHRRGKATQYLGGLHLRLLLERKVAPIPVPSIEGMDEHLTRLVQDADGLLLTEGGDLGPELHPEPADGDVEHVELDPAKDHIESRLVREALERDLPILGICRGMQMINAVLGGDLYDDLPSQVGEEVCHLSTEDYHGHRHPIELAVGSPLHQTYGQQSLAVSSYHHQGISALAPELVAAAASPDGIIEAFHAPERTFVWGLQFHPERQLGDDPRHSLIHAQFAAAAHAHAEVRR